MKEKLSHDFEAKFWAKFESEFGRKNNLFLRIAIPVFATCLILGIFLAKQETRYDPVAVQIALEAEEEAYTLYDVAIDDEDQSWLEII